MRGEETLPPRGCSREERKRALPYLPRVIGVVTSPTGAVIRDILHGLADRFPTRVIVWPVRVQGETCSGGGRGGDHGFNALASLGPFPRPDLLIVARGGGSLEDLWSFNEEAVVRAAAASTIPLISAVGHETDFTLIDMVADRARRRRPRRRRWAVPKHSDLVLRLSECIGRARHCIRRHLEGLRSEFRGAERGLPRPNNLVRHSTPASRYGRSPVGPIAAPFQRALAGPVRALRCPAYAAPHLSAVGAGDRAPRACRGRGWARVPPNGGQEARPAGTTGPSAAVALLSGPRRAPARAFGASGGSGRARLPANHRQEARPDRLDDRAERLQPGLPAAPVARQRERLQSLIARAGQSVRNALKRKASEAGALSQLLRTLSHKSVLDRGFALVRDAEGHVIRRAEAAKAAVLLDIEFADGHVSAKLGEEAQETRAPERKSPAPPHRAKQLNKDDGSQGSLL